MTYRTQKVLEQLNETIVAISSAPGQGPVGIVRMSGPIALTLADSIIQVHDKISLSTCAGSRRLSGELELKEGSSWPATIFVFRSPHSYTRQNSVEIHTVGSPALLEMTRRQLIDLGATPASPGEFTARAFLNGGMDLASAEAVSGVIRAGTDTQLRASRRMMAGNLGNAMDAVRTELAELVALVEADIDFAEEPIEFITPDEAKNRLQSVHARLCTLMENAKSVERLDVLPHVLLLGRPNVGKSTLMNQLSGTPRAICAAAAGTTRDILSAPVSLDSLEVILLDSAGIDQDNDEIIVNARARALETAQTVDLACLVIDLSDPDFLGGLAPAHSLDKATIIVAANKADLLEDKTAQQRLTALRNAGYDSVTLLSALNKTGLEELRHAIASRFEQTTVTASSEAILVSARQRTAIEEATESLDRAIELTSHVEETIDCADVLAFELRDALDTLGTVTGAVTTEDLLGQVFARFCIGK